MIDMITNNKINLTNSNYNFNSARKIFYNNFFINNALHADVVSFGSKEKDLIDKTADEMLKEIVKSIKEENFMGEGGEAIVYKIEGTKYCARINNNLDLNKLSTYKNLSKLEVTEQDKVNHCVAKLGSEISIMPIIPGVPVMTYDMPVPRCKYIAEQIAKLPKETFHKFLKQICDAYDKGMVFDCTWANVIVDVKAQKLTAIDFSKSDEGINVMSYMYASLVHEHTTTEQKRNFAGKILYSVVEELTPGKNPCYSLNNLDINRFIHKLGSENIIENQKYLELLINIFEGIKDLKYSELRGECVDSLLNAKLKLMNALIKQLFKVE